MCRNPQCHELTTGYCDRCQRGVVFARRLNMPDPRCLPLACAVSAGWRWVAKFCRLRMLAWECAECGEQTLWPVPAPFLRGNFGPPPLRHAESCASSEDLLTSSARLNAPAAG